MQIRNLSTLAYAQGFTLWHYGAEGAELEEVTRRGFLDSAGEAVKPGDMVMVSAVDGGGVFIVGRSLTGLMLVPM